MAHLHGQSPTMGHVPHAPSPCGSWDYVKCSDFLALPYRSARAVAKASEIRVLNGDVAAITEACLNETFCFAVEGTDAQIFLVSVILHQELIG
ncbi:hypothetical protein SKAU_G00148900 [Synaphobranchus kaupii]|uniref:Uncharacterized protein n=1 Tax=Synaphobranchus kaupii TaxID=118154 RepID=A0A9Q1FU35_SYNKA|nr:hypothetical protein SKAU_G00148900 [Synaphobranchus kaupii]